MALHGDWAQQPALLTPGPALHTPCRSLTPAPAASEAARRDAVSLLLRRWAVWARWWQVLTGGTHFQSRSDGAWPGRRVLRQHAPARRSCTGQPFLLFGDTLGPSPRPVPRADGGGSAWASVGRPTAGRAPLYMVPVWSLDLPPFSS